MIKTHAYPHLQEIKNNAYNYDAWFDYIRLMENDGTVEQVLVNSHKLARHDDTLFYITVLGKIPNTNQ